MPWHYKSLLIVMLLTGIGLLISRRVFASLMLSDDDFRRRRNLWLSITAAAFLLPSFWAYALFATACVLYTAKWDSNPAALFPLLLVAVPPLQAEIPKLFGVDHQRLLILVLLLPMIPRLMRDPKVPGFLKLPTDKILFAYLVLQVSLYWPYLSSTATLRFTVLLILNTWIPYFVMSRAFTSKAQLRDAMACFVLCMIVLAPLALAEVRLASVLYGDFGSNWDLPQITAYLKREDTLRAQLASGQPIVLGYQFAVAIAMWLYLQKRVGSAFWRMAGICVLIVGLVLPLSRGPWVGAVAIFLAFVLAAPRSLGRATKWGVLAAALFGVAMLTPWGDRIASYLPFIGEADQGSIDYRTQILEVSWKLIRQDPFFGNPYAKMELESLRQGQGIIDIVNVYVAFALAYGFVGVTLFVGLFASVMFQLLKRAKNANTTDDSRKLSASLFASLVGVMVMLSATSNYLTIPYIYLMLIGFAVAYLRVSETDAVRDEPVRRERGAFAGAGLMQR